MQQVKAFSGRRLRARRKELGIIQDDLSATVGVTHQTLATYETGKCAPSAAVLGRLSVALDCTIDSLFRVVADGDGEPVPNPKGRPPFKED